MRHRTLPGLCALLLLVGAAEPGRAVLIDSGDGTGNTGAPPDDPGWDYLAVMGGLSAVYVGEGWMLTAAHAPISAVILLNELYQPVAGSAVQLSNPDESPADLMLFAVHGLPDLPPPPIRTTTPSAGTPVVMAGRGLNRGDFTTWNPPGPGGPYSGWLWGAFGTTRWGTNVVDAPPPPPAEAGNTFAFATSFESGLPTEHEAQGVLGDSGGAVWIDDGGGWELAGLLIGIETYEGQPAAALYGNRSYAADLSVYRDEILEIVALPEPDPATGLLAALGFLVLLGRRRTRA